MRCYPKRQPIVRIADYGLLMVYKTASAGSMVRESVLVCCVCPVSKSVAFMDCGNVMLPVVGRVSLTCRLTISMYWFLASVNSPISSVPEVSTVKSASAK